MGILHTLTQTYVYYPLNSICNQYLYEFVDNFTVFPLNELSYHSKINTIFKSSFKCPEFDADNYKWNALGKKFKWDKENKKRFSNALKENAKEIDDISRRIDAGVINSTGEKSQNLFKTAANSALAVKIPYSLYNQRKIINIV